MSFFHDKDRDLLFGFDGDLLTVGLTRKFIPPTWEEGGGGGGGVDGTPARSF